MSVVVRTRLPCGLGALELHGAVARATERVITLHDGTVQAPVRRLAGEGAPCAPSPSSAHAHASSPRFASSAEPTISDQTQRNRLQSIDRPNRARQGKARQGKARQGKARRASRYTRVLKDRPQRGCARVPTGCTCTGQPKPRPAVRLTSSSRFSVSSLMPIGSVSGCNPPPMQPHGRF